jgi:alanine racemase
MKSHRTWTQRIQLRERSKTHQIAVSNEASSQDQAKQAKKEDATMAAIAASNQAKTMVEAALLALIPWPNSIKLDQRMQRVLL